MDDSGMEEAQTDLDTRDQARLRAPCLHLPDGLDERLEAWPRPACSVLIINVERR